MKNHIFVTSFLENFIWINFPHHNSQQGTKSIKTRKFLNIFLENFYINVPVCVCACLFVRDSRKKEWKKEKVKVEPKELKSVIWMWLLWTMSDKGSGTREFLSNLLLVFQLFTLICCWYYMLVCRFLNISMMKIEMEMDGRMDGLRTKKVQKQSTKP